MGRTRRVRAVVGWGGGALWVVAVVATAQWLAAEDALPVATSETLVEMAYAAEVSGQATIRDALVEKILDREPDNERARWLIGQVRGGNGWESAASDATPRSGGKWLGQYVERREACGEDAASRLKLANWCRDHDMPDREKVHLREIVAWHGGDPALMARLGMVKFRGQWVSEERVEEFRQLDDRRRRAEKSWKPVFAEWKDDLEADDAAAYKRLAERLREVNDGDSLPVLEEVLSTHSEKAALAVVDRLDSLSMQDSIESLVRHAVFSEFEAVRAAACEALKRRPKYNYIPMLLAGLVAPVEVTVELPQGGTNYVRRTAIQRGPDFNLKTVDHQAQYAVRVRFSNPPVAEALAPQLPPTFGPGSYVEESGERVQWNKRIREVLYSVTGESYRNPRDWWDWWGDYTDLYDREDERPTIEQHRYRQNWTYGYVVSRDVGAQPNLRSAHSCLAWGTPVVTETGSRPIEQIVPGDKVLAQDADTGQLGYRVVLQRTVRRLGEMRKIAIGADSLTVTKGHPFWVVGEGWKMAKELEVGWRVRGLDACPEISAIEKLPEDVAYNLVVDDFATYFAGDSRVLLHDNTLPKPTDAVLPGYAPGSR